MLGQQIRGIRHLYKLASESPKGVRIFNITGVIGINEYIVFPCVRENTVLLIPFSPDAKNGSSFGFNLSDLKEECRDNAKELLYSAIARPFFVDNFNHNTHPFGGVKCGGNSVVVSTTEFEKDYAEFCKTNNKVLSSVFDKYASSSCALSRFLYVACDGNANFMAWSIKMIARHKASIFSILHLMQFNTEHGNLIKNITKGNIIALSSCSDIANAITDIFHLRAQTVAKQTINWFNPLQKKLLREKLDDNEIIHLLNNFSRLSKTKRINFIRKVSTLEDSNEILKMMSFLCTNTHFKWNKESFLDFLANVENLNYEIVVNEGSFVILKVNDYETVKRLGKNTNWCISKNLQYWERYMGGGEPIHHPFGLEPHLYTKKDDSEGDSEYDIRFKKLRSSTKENANSAPIQFMAFDFNEKEDSIYSIVGFTATPIKGIIYAHDFVNKNMLGETVNGDELVVDEEMPRQHRQRINPLEFKITHWDIDSLESPQKHFVSLIHNFLNEHNVDINDLCNHIYTRCEWNKESVCKFISEYCDPNDIVVLFEDDERLILRSYTDNIAAIMPDIDLYFTCMLVNEEDSHIMNKGCIVHFDFSKKINSTDKFLIWKIFENYDKNIEECASNAMDETGHFDSKNPFSVFENMLDYYGLPFDVIKRPNTIDFKINEYAKIRNYDKVLNLLEEAEQRGDNISKKTIKNIVNLIEYMIDVRNIDFFKKLFTIKVNLFRLLKEDFLIQITDLMFNYIIYLSITNETVRAHNLYSKCNDWSSFIALNKKTMEGWMEYATNPEIGLQKKRNAAKKYALFFDITGYSMIFDTIIHKIENDGCINIYDIIVPRMINKLYECDIAYVNNSKTAKEVMNHFIKENFNKWNKITYNDAQTLFKLLCYDNYHTIIIPKIRSILKDDLKPKNISKLIMDLDLYSNGQYNNKSFNTVLKLICNVAKNSHIVSESTVNDMLATRNTH